MKEKNKNIITRPPIVVVLGHVDHGKSSILESIREDFAITAKESGGITQRIGAYEAEFQGKKITFVDTPGHEAFSAMRERGAKIADIAVLVVDACEGVKTQTKEALKFAKEAGLPLIVAINKIDKPGALPEKIKKELNALDVVVESYGGKVPSVNVSAKTKQGIDELLETILLVAEIEELKADLSALAEGIVVESFLDSQKGAVVSIILTNGVLQEGDILGGTSGFGKVKCIFDFQGKRINKVLPGQPANVLGFEIPAKVGDCVKVYLAIEQVKAVLGKNENDFCSKKNVLLQEGQKVFNIILKADVIGSLEAVVGILKALPQEKAIPQILKAEVGDINVSDLRLAEGAMAKVYGFRVKMEDTVKQFAEQKKIKPKIFDIIYDLSQEARKDITNILDVEIKRVDLGRFQITVLFKQGKSEQIIGGRVLEGEIMPETMVEILRQEEKIGKGRIRTVQQEKKNVGKVMKGREAAMLLKTETKIMEGDILLVYREERQKGVL